MNSNRGLKLIAVLEASKGLLSLIVAFGIHILAGENLQHIAEQIVSHAHLNPAKHYPSLFIHLAGTLSNHKMNWLALGALGYSSLRFVEAYGLWKSYTWTEWLALISGAIYIPFEIYNIIQHQSAVDIMILLVNLIVVSYMSFIIFINKGKK